MKKPKDKNIAKEIMSRLKTKDPAKSPRTLYLNTENYLRLEEYAKKNNRKPGHIIDELISLFLEQMIK